MSKATCGWTPAEYAAAIEELRIEHLGNMHLILASNRGPVEFRTEAGALRVRRGEGGLVTALASMVEVVDTTWVAAPMTPEDRLAAARHGDRLTVPMGARPLRLAFVPVERADFHRYYDEIANSVLWFLQHGLTDAVEHPEFDEATWRAWETYRQVNLAFATEIVRVARADGRPPVVLVQDYHLYLVPLFLRRMLPEATLVHFTHIAWPGPDLWRLLPGSVREEILAGLLSCDLVGLHTPSYVRNFARTCEDLLGVQLEGDRAHYQGHEVRVRAYPISIDPDGLRTYAASDEVRAQEAELTQARIHQTLNLVQVARTDPSKNLLRTLKAYELFLDRHPRYHGQVRFWGVLPASRQGAERYRSYLERLKAQGEAINRRFRRRGWQPLELTWENSYPRAIAVMKHYDALVVNSLADGMNLVAKEGPIVNQRAGVLLLSEHTGACEELSDGALCLHPCDLVGTADAFHQALTMPAFQRERMQALSRRQIELHPIFRWVYEQLRDVAALLPRTPRLRIMRYERPRESEP